MIILHLEEIKQKLPHLDLLPIIEQGFVAYSRGKAVVPPVGELVFEDPPGDVHIKYGYIRGDDIYVVKIASGFYRNPELGLPSGNGLMLVFSRKTGELQAVLLDEGHLTDIRTAVAGAIAAKYLAPEKVERVGIVGTGTQARLQLAYLKSVTSCRNVLVWGRHRDRVLNYCQDMARQGFQVEAAPEPETLVRNCNLIVTTTPARKPIVLTDWVQAGTHITAVGADTPEKQELEAELLAAADVVVADSISQCLERGEIVHAVRQGILRKEDLVELGEVIVGAKTGRTSPEQVTVADLTGVAVQDIQIARCFLNPSN